MSKVITSLPPLTKGKGHISINAATKALVDGERLLRNIVSPNWNVPERRTRSGAQSGQRSPEVPTVHFEKAISLAEQ